MRIHSKWPIYQESDFIPAASHAGSLKAPEGSGEPGVGLCKGGRIDKEPSVHRFPPGGCPAPACALRYDSLAGNYFVRSTVTCAVTGYALPGIQSPSVLPPCKERGQAEAQPALSCCRGVAPAPSSAGVVSWWVAGALGGASALRVSATFRTRPGPWTSALPVQKRGRGVWEIVQPPSSPCVYF